MKNPAFQFYVQDFLMGTLSFSAEEIGAYILLLCHQWDKGFIKEKEVTNVARVPMQNLSQVLTKFSKRNGRLKNKKLEIVRNEKKQFSKTQSDKGKKGAEARWHRPSSGHDSGYRQAMAKNSSSSSTSSSTSVVVEANNDTFFEMFRRVAGKHITDQELMQEVGKFKNKYPNAHPNKSGGLINSWVSRIGEQQTVAANPCKPRIVV